MADCRSLLTDQLAFLHKNVHVYLGRFPGEDRLGWRPAPEFFTLFELGAHLCAAPAFTAAVLRGEADEEIFKWDVPIRQGTADDLGRLLDEAMAACRDALARFDADAFMMAEAPSPFGAATPAKHLLDLVTHMHHHRGQLHNYLRALGTGVSTDTLYAAE